MKEITDRRVYDVDYTPSTGFSRGSADIGTEGVGRCELGGACERARKRVDDGKWESENRSINPIKFRNASGPGKQSGQQ